LAALKAIQNYQLLVFWDPAKKDRKIQQNETDTKLENEWNFMFLY
jgi:hypothetical protein